MSYASRLAESWQHRAGQPRDSALDAYYQYEWTLLRDMLSRLEAILQDEGVPGQTAERILRGLLHGSPSPVAAELRMRQEQEMVKLLNEKPLSMSVPLDRAAAERLLAIPPEWRPASAPHTRTARSARSST